MISWVITILAVIVIGTILDIFLSEKKLGKFVRNIFSSLVVLLLISPIPVLLTDCSSIKEDFLFSNVNLDTSYINYANKQKVKYLQNGVEEALAADGYKKVIVTIDADMSKEIEIELARVDISKMVIETGVGNINKVETIRNLVAKYLNIQKSLVIIDD
jgi:energy-coupling factor transporter transmembrane protein EcfT